MSKFRCTCGYIIGFNVTPCRYEAHAIRDHGSEAVYDSISQEIAQFMADIGNGRRDDWLQRLYGDVFPISNDGIIDDIISRHLMDYALAVFQCERCGRLWLQTKPKENAYDSYLPEGQWRGALETPAEGFVGYIEEETLFNSRIATVRQEAGVVQVIIKTDAGMEREIVFAGVSTVKQYDTEEKSVRFLSEWKDIPPLRRFLFDSTSQSFDPLLEITAEAFHMSS